MQTAGRIDTSRAAEPDDSNGAEREQTESDPSTEQLRRAIRRRGRTIEQRELERAITRLDAMDGLTDERREVLTETALAITEDVLAAPLTSLSESEDFGDADLERIETLLTPE